MIDIPIYSADLIEQLLKSYPERVPKPSEDIADIMYYAGKRELVLSLKEKLKQQQEDEFAKKLKGE